MKEQFEKVKFWQLEEGSSVGVSMLGRFVNRADYDALLAYTKELANEVERVKTEYAELRDGYHMAVDDLAEAIGDANKLQAQLDAVVGQETPQHAFERGFDEGVGAAIRQVEISVQLHPRTKLEMFVLEAPPYTPPLKAGTE